MSSVYFWDLDDGFAGVVLLKKSMCIEYMSYSTYRDTGVRSLTTWGDSDTKREKRRGVGFDSCL